MQPDAKPKSDETDAAGTDGAQPAESRYSVQLTKPVTKPRQWTIQRVETVIGSIA